MHSVPSCKLNTLYPQCILFHHANLILCALNAYFLQVNCKVIGYRDLHSTHAYILYHAVFSNAQLRFKVYLDEGQRVAEIFVTPTTKCRDIVQRLQRQIHEPDCFLLEVWQGCGRLHASNLFTINYKMFSLLVLAASIEVSFKVSTEILTAK